MEGKTILLGPGESLIGRGPYSEIFLPNEYVSWKHAYLNLSNNNLYIRDISTNGTWVNGKRIRSITKLKPEDNILIAEQVSIRIISLLERSKTNEKQTIGYRSVLFLSPTNLIDSLEKNIQLIYEISPDQFELLVCNRLEKMGFNVNRVGSIYIPDGGIDIIAYSEHPVAFPTVIAVQAKHHKSPWLKTGPNVVKEMQSIVNYMPFQGGLIVTNSYFTEDAKWYADKRPHLVRLRDFNDLKQWINSDCCGEKEVRELPNSIEFRPGKTVSIPIKPQKN